jgi:uncharacterized RDD family membrane protein YckC
VAAELVLEGSPAEIYGREVQEDAKPGFCELCARPLTGAERALGATRCAEHARPPRDDRPAAPLVAITPAATDAAVAGPGQEEAAPADYAGFWPRAGAYVIDYVFTNVASFAVLIAAAFITVLAADRTGDIVLREDQDAILLIAVVTGAFGATVVSTLYFWLGDAWGGTPGKRLVGLSVVDERAGGDIGLARGFVRFLVSMLGAAAFYVGWLWCIWDARKQAWHDKAARSVVVASVAQPAGPRPWRRGMVGVAAAALGAWLFVALVVGGSVVGRNPEARLSGQQLNPGDCIRYLRNGYVPVGCDADHDAEVLQTYEMDGADGSYPNEAAIAGFASQHCSVSTTYYTFPTEDTWRIGDRRIACLLER